MTEISKEFDKSLEILKKAYISKLKTEITYYQNALNLEYTTTFLEDLKLHVHKLSGSAGVYGFDELCKSTHELDLLLQNVLKAPSTLNVSVIKEQIRGIIHILELT